MPQKTGSDFSFLSTHLLCTPRDWEIALRSGGPWGDRGGGLCPSLPLLCHSLPFAVFSFPPSCPLFSLDNKRDSPGAGGTASDAFPGSKMQKSAKRWLDGVSNENGAPHLLSGSIANVQTPSGQDPSMGWGKGLKEACPVLGWPRPETLCPLHAKGCVPKGMCQYRPSTPLRRG